MLIFDGPHKRRFPFVLRVEDGQSTSEGGSEKKDDKPQFVPAEEFKQFQATMTGFMETMKTTMEGFSAMASQPRQDAPPKKDEITAEAYADAIADPSADGARKVIADYERQREERLKRHADERIASIEQTGIGALESVNLSQMKTARNSKGDLLYPHFDRFEKQINDRMKTLHPSMRAQPVAWQQLYKVIIGENFETLVGEEREKVLRSGDDKEKGKAGEPPASAAGRGQDKKTGPPTARDLGGDESERALVAAGKDQDGMAKRMGYKDWADYMEKCKEHVIR